MDQDELLHVVSAALERLALPYFVTGSVATIYFGEPRFTNDIDIVAALSGSDVDAFCAEFAGPDFYLDRQSVVLAIRNRSQFNLIHPGSGLKADIMIPVLDEYNRGRFARARKLPLDLDSSAVFASPEDVILKKMEYYQRGGSEKHLRDIAGVLRISGARLDREYLALWVERRGFGEIWRALLFRLGL